MRTIKGRRIDRACDTCGAIYPAVAWQIKQGVGVTCSRACGNRLRALKNTRGTSEPCAACGAPVHVEPSARHHQQFFACSTPCQSIALSRLFAARRPLITRPCPACGTPYDVDERALARGKRTTCSRACSYQLRMQTRQPARFNPRAVTPEHTRVRILAKTRAYKARHREDVNRRQSAYIKANPEIAYLAEERRRARKAAAPQCDLTRAQWRAIKAAFDNRCAYCGEQFERLTMDHVVPLSKGGSHTAANVVPACRSCNCRKGTKLIAPTFLPEDPFYLLKI